MGSIWVSGGKFLCGETSIQGSKNAALPLMAAAVLHRGTTVLHNCPKIQDVECMRLLLEDLGCKTGAEGHTLWIDASEIRKNELDAALTARMRGSVLLMGALLGRCQEVILPFPGGCVIGKRPVNYHLDIMQRMGTEVVCQGDRMILRTQKLKGMSMEMQFPSVGATENGILAGTLADGITTLRRCAVEPEILELCYFLREKGAKIHMWDGAVITEGIKELHDSEYTLMPDRIVAGTYLLAVLAARGDAILHNVPLDMLNALTEIMANLGVCIRRYHGNMDEKRRMRYTVRADCRIRNTQRIDVDTAPYPGFPTDLQSPLMAAMTACDGSICHIHESVFENRFMIAAQLKRMGADIRIRGPEALVYGVPKLYGANMSVKELRGGAALVLAALAAEGVSQIEPDDYIKRGYENIVKDLEELGADICMGKKQEDRELLAKE